MSEENTFGSDTGYESNDSNYESNDQGYGYEGQGHEDGRSVNDAIQQAEKKWKLQDGDYEEEVDEKTLLEYARKVRAADRRFQEAAEHRKFAEERSGQLENIWRFMNANPEEALRRMGRSPEEIRALAESIVRRDVEERLMTPEEKERRAEQMAAKQWREHQEAQRKHQEAERVRQQNEAELGNIETGLAEAFRKLGVVTDDHVRDYGLAMEAVKFLMADARKAKASGGDLTLSYEEAVKKAVYSNHRAIQQYLNMWGPEQLEKALGPEKMKALREHDLKKNRRQQTTQTTAPKISSNYDRVEERQYIDPKDFSRMIRSGK